MEPVSGSVSFFVEAALPARIPLIAIALAGMVALLLRIAKIELHELQRIGIGLIQAQREFNDAVTIAAAGHAAVDLGQQGHIRGFAA
jgi:hypothetical protein